MKGCRGMRGASRGAFRRPRGRFRARAVWAVAVLLAWPGGIQAGPGDGINIDIFNVSPFLESKYIYDSNVPFQPPGGERSGNYYITDFGLEIASKGDRLRTRGKIWDSWARYTDFTQQNHEDLGAQLSLELGRRDHTTIQASGDYLQVEALDYTTGTIEERRKYGAGVGVGQPLTDKLAVSGAYGMTKTEYTSEQLYGWTGQGLSARAMLNLTAKTAAGLLWSGGTQTSEGQEGEARNMSMQLGLESRRTQKVTGRASAGWMMQQSDVADSSSVAFDVGVSWRPRNRVTVYLKGNNSFEPSVDQTGNDCVATSVGADLTVQFTDIYFVSLSEVYRDHDYSRPVEMDGVEYDRSDTTLTSALRLTCVPRRKWLEVFAEARYEQRDSSVPLNSYDQWMGSIGAKVRY